MKQEHLASMTSRAMPRRRGLIAAAIGGGAIWISGRSRSAIGSGCLAALCSELRYFRTIGDACLEALPATENSRDALTRAILEDIWEADRDISSASALSRWIRERSRNDFREGRIVTVDRWMLSLTETRVYALAALSPRPTVE